MSNEIEIWKDVPNYEGHYQVSNFGRVKSLKRNKEKILSQSVSTNGYLSVNLSNGSSRKTFLCHSLMAKAFFNHITDGTNKICVDHINNTKLDNRLCNLQLITVRENNCKDKKNGSSKYNGVHFDKNSKKYYSSIKDKLNRYYLGSFDIELDAANAYKKALSEINQGLDLNIIYPKGRHKTSGYNGVSWHKQYSKWQATYSKKFIGYFFTELEAYQAIEKHIKNLQTK